MKAQALAIAAASALSAPVAFAILDENGNGLSDLYEMQFNNGTLPSPAWDPLEDYDLDGWTTDEEAAAGTNPFDPNPPDGLVRPDVYVVPEVWGDVDLDGIPDLITAQTVVLSWPSIPGKQYTLLYSVDLVNWAPVPGEVHVGNGSIIDYGWETPDSEKLFWMVKVEDIDSDSDALTNAEEAVLGLDCNNAQTIHGLPDIWLAANFTTVLLSSGPSAIVPDPDADGLTNEQERFLGTNPNVVDNPGILQDAIRNGDFAIPEIGSSGGLNNDQNEPYWNYWNGLPELPGEHSWSAVNGTNIEYQNWGDIIDKQSQFCELKADPEGHSGITQRVGTRPGVTYLLVFDCTTRDDTLLAADNNISIKINNQEIDTVEFYDYQYGVWLTKVCSFTATKVITEITLVPQYPDSDPTYGGFIDNVKLAPMVIGVDNDRDGIVRLKDANDITSSDKPYRFWLNNDHDNYTNDTYDANDDHPWTTKILDSDDMQIDSERDLDDFAQLHIGVGDVCSLFADGQLTLGLKWMNISSGAPSIRLFTAVEPEGGTKYLSDAVTAAAQVGQSELGVVSGAGVFDLPVSFWTSTASKSTKHLIFEALTGGKGELSLVVKQNNSVLMEGEYVCFQLMDVREMYERWKITDTASIPDPDTATAASVSGVSAVNDPNGNSFQPSWDEDADDRSYIICVHGWRKSYAAARSDEITIFKRLWHRGFKGRYVGFFWPTLTGDELAAKYNHSEYRAWKCGDAFKSLVESGLSVNYRKNLICHSMGNIVAASAIHQGLTVDRYALLNGAISAQCFDSNPLLKQVAATQTLSTGFAFPSTISYNAWAGGDLGDDPVAALNSLSYRGRVGLAPLGVMKLINFYLANDLATKDAWEANQWAAGDYLPSVDSKPIDGYAYDVGVRLNYNPLGPGDRALTDAHEAMAMTNQSMTKAVGAESRTGGAITGSVDLNGPGMLFGNEHEAVFKYIPSKTWEFYGRLLQELNYQPKP